MRATLVVFATLTAAVVLPTAPASAQSVPFHEWCVTVDEAGTSCNYDTLQQCMAFASGNGGFCDRNPSVTGSVTAAPGTDRATRRKVNRQRASS
jgi:hypothetical protein